MKKMLALQITKDGKMKLAEYAGLGNKIISHFLDKKGIQIKEFSMCGYLFTEDTKKMSKAKK